MSPNYKINNDHGGNLKEAKGMFGFPVQGWLDLSTGVNLKAYSNVKLMDRSLQMLPQQEQMDMLLAAARRFYRVPPDMEIIAAPGSQVLIQHLPTLSSDRLVSIVGPTYAEHAKSWAEGGHKVSIVDNLADIQCSDIAVIVNPNNPNGKITPCNELLYLANKKIDGKGLLVIDEAFADAEPKVSMIPLLTNDSTVVLRSFGKFFGLPGIRLGFAIGAPFLIDQLRKKLGPWAVSGPAIEIGARALNDTRWIGVTRTQLLERCERLDSILQRGGGKITGGTSLFRLIEHESAQKIFQHLGELGIFVRKFPEYKTWLRLGVPVSKSDFSRLEDAFYTAVSN